MDADAPLVQRRITEFWSAVGPHYNGDPENVAALGTDEYASWVDVVRELLPPPPCDVLDVGTGTGFVAMIASGLGHRVTGIDLAEGMLDVARGDAAVRGLRVTFVAGDAVAPDFAEASFDVVTNRLLLWTLREPGVAFGNWLRLLRPGGRAVSIHRPWRGMPVSEEPGERVGFFEQHYTEDVRAAIPGMNTDGIEPFVDMLRRAGFGDVTVKELVAVRCGDAGPFALVASR